MRERAQGEGPGLNHDATDTKSPNVPITGTSIGKGYAERDHLVGGRDWDSWAGDFN